MCHHYVTYHKIRTGYCNQGAWEIMSHVKHSIGNADFIRLPAPSARRVDVANIYVPADERRPLAQRILDATPTARVPAG